ncbi:hypothetical protein [Nannocystis sp. SCPEA4]|uniref:DUF6939 family protein n=1 Tax=Nannocystis sp. SCPEA4 TaxID=2996787 RepID=UPI00226EA28B|nr:hypothetical protein [Nannocystis sp. SCPEA4]MCY1055379.1 hypothetical protein [Nannocystis sp. SCPEA4]
MSFHLYNRHALAHVGKRFPGATVLDLTSRGPDPWVRFSPFYPHRGVPIPFTPGRTAASVEGVWQALKVFSKEDVDPSKLDVTTMKGLKRTVQRLGPCLGHREGLAGERLLSYAEARRRIYLPTYRWVLDHRLGPELAELRRLGALGPVVLLDYETNPDPDDLSRPLSHVGLVIHLLQGTWPETPAPSDI